MALFQKKLREADPVTIKTAPVAIELGLANMETGPVTINLFVPWSLTRST
jgi:hypothetical protein